MMNKFLLYAVEHLPILKTEEPQANLDDVVGEISNLKQLIEKYEKERKV